MGFRSIVESPAVATLARDSNTYWKDYQGVALPGWVLILYGVSIAALAVSGLAAIDILRLRRYGLRDQTAGWLFFVLGFPFGGVIWFIRRRIYGP